VIARKAFSACMPEGFDVGKYLDTHIDLYLPWYQQVSH